MSYKVVEIQEEDNPEICALFEKAFGKPMCKIDSSEIFSWFYFNNIYKQHYCRGLYNGKVFSAYWGFIPIDCIINDKILKGSLSFQLVSSQEILGATLLLWKKIKKELINDNVVLTYTINHENSVKLFKNIGSNVKTTPILINILHPFKLINDLIVKRISNRILIAFFSRIFLSLDYLFSKLVALFRNKSANVIIVDYFDKDYNDLWNVMSKSLTFGVSLDARYVNWRYINKPNNNYKILAYLENEKIMGYLIYATKKDFGTHIGYIMDIIASPENKYVIDKLIYFAKQELFYKGVTIISALSFKDNIFYDNYKGNGFLNFPEIFLPHKSYFSINNFYASETKINVNDWHISWGNHDNV